MIIPLNIEVGVSLYFIYDYQIFKGKVAAINTSTTIKNNQIVETKIWRLFWAHSCYIEEKFCFDNLVKTRVALLAKLQADYGKDELKRLSPAWLRGKFNVEDITPF